jgi:hypothetical protein
MVMDKIVLYGSITIFSALGSWIPSLWDAGFFSFWGIIGGVVGCLVGIWAYSLLQSYIDV